MKKKTRLLTGKSITKKKSTPLVSVIIPVFNGASYLQEAVLSIQKSTMRNFEIVLLDDGSTDHSKKICQFLTKKYANVAFYSFYKNKGLSHALNFALKKAQGKYICRLNQDDRMLPKRLKTQVEFLDSHPQVVAVGSSIKLFDNNNNSQIIHFLQHDEDIKKIWHIVSPFSDPSVMYRKDVAQKAGGYLQEYWPADDTHLWYRMGKLGKLANLSTPVVEVRWHNKAASVYHFRKLAVSTYKMHQYAHLNIGRASLAIQIFWVIQLFCGLLFSPAFNWGVYRMLKRAIHIATTKKKTFSISVVIRSLPLPTYVHRKLAFLPRT